MLSRAPECVPPVPGRLIIRPPTKQADIESAMSSAFEHVQGRAATVRHVERWPHECDRHPHTLLREFDGLADASKGGLAVDPRDDVITRTRRVGACLDERHRGESVRGSCTLCVQNGRWRGVHDLRNAMHADTPVRGEIEAAHLARPICSR